MKYVYFASTEYITVIISRIPKINDPQRCSRKIFVEDNGDRHRYSGAMTGMSRFLPPHVRRETERLREFRMQARNASQNRLQSDWRESLWRSFSFNFSIRPPRRGTETGVSSVFSRLAVCQALPSFHYGDVSFDRAYRMRTCMRDCLLLYSTSMLPVCLWIRTMTAYWLLLHSIYRMLSFSLIYPHLYVPLKVVKWSHI